MHGRQLAHRLQSAPASLAASRESLLDMMTPTSRAGTPSAAANDVNKRFSADLSHLYHSDVMAQGRPAAATGARAHPPAGKVLMYLWRQLVQLH